MRGVHQSNEELAFYNKPLSANDKGVKLLHTLPTRSAPMTMVGEASSVLFENFIASVKAAISERKLLDQQRMYRLWLPFR